MMTGTPFPTESALAEFAVDADAAAAEQGWRWPTDAERDEFEATRYFAEPTPDYAGKV